MRAVLISCLAGALSIVACSTSDALDGKGTCGNGIRDTSELGRDCGGSCAACDGETCSGGEGCASGRCENAVCAPSGDKTCGVGVATLCVDATKCQQDGDCISDYCEDLCSGVPANVHEDGRRNGGETGKDCGGTASDKPCGAGEGCKTSSDCLGQCNAGLCNPPGPTDGKKNVDESDVDCGGATAPRCTIGKTCVGSADCQLRACTVGKCVEPTATDNVQNGDESDVDCGGGTVTEGTISYQAPRCKQGKTCAGDGDCVTSLAVCGPSSKKCTLPSCATAETAGIVTCGAKEANDPANAHDSCCRSLSLPTRTARRLDKYEITAGRFRAFLSKKAPDIRAFVTEYAAGHPNSQLAKLLTLSPNVKNIFPATQSGRLGVVAHMSIDIDNYAGIRGCYNWYDAEALEPPIDSSYGANTYWQPDPDMAQFGLPTRGMPREESDQKPLNCAMPIMYAAFCAWDGDAELAMLADYVDAWPQTYPWGTTDIQRPNYNWCNGRLGNGNFNCQNTALGTEGIFYAFPSNVPEYKDLATWIGAPGRFPMDATALKSGGESWMDLFANLTEYTGDFEGTTQDFCDFSAAPDVGATTCTRANKPPGSVGQLTTGIPRTRIVGRSWEGHEYGKGTAFEPATFQYGKFGGRCARPAE